MSVQSVPLEDVCEINPSTAFNLSNDSPCTFVPMEAVDDWSAQIVKLAIRPFREVSKGYTSFAENDVLLAKITPCMENGKCAIARRLRDRVGFGSTEFHVLRASKHVLPEWLLYFWRLPETRWNAERSMTGTAGQKRVPSSHLERIKIPLPDLPEQKRIVGQLEQADRLRRTRRYARQVSGTFVQSLFIDMFGHPGQALQRFEVSALQDVVRFIDYRGIAPNKVASGVPLVTARNVKRGYFEFEPREFIPTDEYEKWMTRGKPAQGDVLFTTEGHTLGSAAKLPAFPRVALAQRLITMSCGNGVTSDYLLQFILTNCFQDAVAKRSTGSAARGISSKNLGEIMIPIPPLPLQQQFSGIAARHERLRAQQHEAERQAEHLFQTVLHKAFDLNR